MTRAEVYKRALEQIIYGPVCASYEYDPIPTEQEIAKQALAEAEKLPE